MKILDWAELLRGDSLLSTLDEKNLQWLLSNEVSTEYSYEPGAVIVRAVLFAGDQTISLSRMLKGETFGEMGFFERRPRSEAS